MLKIAAARTGLRSYLAVWGGIPVPLVQGSRATDLACRLGGFRGRALRKGDVLPTAKPGDAAAAWWKTICRRKADRPFGGRRRPYRCAAVAVGNRTGSCRFCGRCPAPSGRLSPRPGRRPSPTVSTGSPPTATAWPASYAALDCTVHGADILSDGIVEGSVQVGGNGQPIVMLADHQTTGGYAKIATVITADLPALAQLRPGQAVAFTLTDPVRAVAAARAQAACLQQVKARLNDFI